MWILFSEHIISFKLAELIHDHCLNNEQDGGGYLEGYRPDRGRSAGWSASILSNPVSISCSAATISAATVLFPMCAAGSEAVNPKDIIREIERTGGRWRGGGHAPWTECQFLRQESGRTQSPLHSFLQEVEKIEGLERIRFMTSHPKDLSDELIDVMKHSKKDLPSSSSAAAVRQQSYPKADEP